MNRGTATSVETLKVLRSSARHLMSQAHVARMVFPEEPAFGPVVGLLSRIEKVLSSRIEAEKDHVA